MTFGEDHQLANIRRDLEGRRILLVEDEAMITMLLEDMLGDLGCQVVGPADSVELAMDIAGGATPIDAAILDVNLGGRPVFGVADTLRAKGIPIIFSSGYGASQLREVDRASPVLGKPFRLEELAVALRSAFAPQ